VVVAPTNNKIEFRKKNLNETEQSVTKIISPPQPKQEAE
jgi:hypothetical protein